MKTINKILLIAGLVFSTIAGVQADDCGSASDGGTLSGGTTICTGGSATLTLTGHNGNLQWQKREEEQTQWTNISVLGTTYNISGLTISTEYRVKAQSGTCVEDYSNIVTVNVDLTSLGGALSGTQSFCDEGLGTLTLSGHRGDIQKWQTKTNGGSWSDITTTASSYGYDHDVTGIYEYRVEVKNGQCAVDYSSIATIYVGVPGTINTVANPPISEAAYGEEISLQLTNHTGTETHWDWEVSFDDGVNYEVLDPTYHGGDGSSTGFDTYDFTILEKTVFRAKVAVDGCTDQYTAPVTIDLNDTATPLTDYRQIQSTTLLEAEDDDTQIPVSGEGSLTQVSYLNGLGAPLKTVSVNSTSDKKDIVSFGKYTAHSTTQKRYLPYVSSDGLGASFDVEDLVTEQSDFYTTPLAGIAASSFPYAEVESDGSPIGRVKEQGAPGSDWQLTGGNTVKYNYRTNAAKEVRLWNEDGTSDAYYPADELWVSQMTDENGHLVEQFTDKRGKTVLKRVQKSTLAPTSEEDWAYTYNIYDKIGRLIYVVPPMAVEEYITEIQPAAAGTGLISETTNYEDITNPSDEIAVIAPAILKLNPGTTIVGTSTMKRLYAIEDIDEVTRVSFLDTWVYQYTYDDRGRLVEKKVPGKAVEYFIYDEMDRLLLLQDGILRGSNQWTYVKYDQRHRPVMTGLYTDATNTTRALMQAVVDGLNYSIGSYYEEHGTAAHHYTNQAFPTTGTEVLSVSYYDSYDINRNGTDNYTYTTSGLSPEPVALTNVHGLATATKVKVLNGSPSDWLESAVFYDKYGRTIQAYADNHLGGDVVSTTVYDFNGRPLKTKTIHDAYEMITINSRNEYDHAGRLKKSFTKVDNDTEIETASYDYNELGQLIAKKVHSEDQGSSYLQEIDYGYTIRGWLKNINDPDQIESDGDYFAMELFRNETLGGSLSQTKGYNGNISGIKWGENVIGESNTKEIKGYAFQYDALDRLTDATYGEGGSFNIAGGTYDEKAMDYDANGNMTNLHRYSNVGATATKIDDLNYTYATGNQLDKVDDASTTSSEMGLNDVSGTDYLYDVNGNVIEDDNKGIEMIVYNYMNKPTLIEFEDGKELRYTYSAAGIKLTVELFDADGTTSLLKTEYSGAFEYKDGVLQHIHTAGGKVVPATSDPNEDWEHEYYLTDHLGNVRVAYRNRSESFTFTATMESENSTTEEQEFSNVASTRQNVGTTVSPAPTGDEVAMVNSTQMVGPGISLPVYPGDKIDMETYAYYQAGTDYGTLSSLSSFIGAVAGAFGGVSGGTTSENNIFNVFDGAFNSTSGLAQMQGNESSTRPAAYLNYLLFNTEFIVVQSGFLQVGTNANSSELLSMQNVTAKHEGFIYIYVSNESASQSEVYFDDLKVTINESNIVQKNSYYPFGLQHASSWSRVGRENKYQFNAASEFNEETQNYEMFFRSYDPVIGRMSGIDPYAHLYASHTPYHYALNDPMFFNDPSGGLVSWLQALFDESDDGSGGGSGVTTWTNEGDGIFTSDRGGRVNIYSGYGGNERGGSTSGVGFKSKGKYQTGPNKGKKYKRIIKSDKNANWQVYRNESSIGFMRESFGGDGFGLDLARIDIGENVNRDDISDYTVYVIADNLIRSGNQTAKISSGFRGIQHQARVMTELIEGNTIQYARNLYKSSGDKIVDVYSNGLKHDAILKAIDAGEISRSEIIELMASEIKKVGPTKVSRHGSDFNVINVIDIAPTSLTDPAAFWKSLKNDPRIDQNRLFSPFTKPRDPAFHIEIKQ